MAMLTMRSSHFSLIKVGLDSFNDVTSEAVTLSVKIKCFVNTGPGASEEHFQEIGWESVVDACRTKAVFPLLITICP